MTQRTQYSDEHLIALIKKGDLSAFECLYEKYANKVFKQCLIISASYDDAQDLMQEVWIKVFFGIESFKGKSAFSRWLSRVTSNHCINYLKKKQATPSIDKMDEDVPYDNGIETRTEVTKILSLLSPEDRILLVGKFMEEFTYEELAERMGMGVSAVKMRISRLTKKLKKELEA